MISINIFLSALHLKFTVLLAIGTMLHSRSLECIHPVKLKL